MASSELIIIDDVLSYRRVALIRDGDLDQIWFDDAEKDPYQTGAVVAVRIGQKFNDHNRITVTLDGIAGSLRLSDNHNHRPGDMIAATVMGAARDDGFGQKPLQLKEAAHVSSKAIPSESGLITPAPDALERAISAAPDAAVMHDNDGSLWRQYDLDLHLEQALHPHLNLAEGGQIVISTPPGAAIIDGDSTNSRLAPLALAKVMVPFVMRQIRLRRIGGPIVIDFPRLDDNGRKTIHMMMRAEAKKDPLKPSLHSFTRGGLYTMARPWRDRVLINERIATDRLLGLDVFRLIRAHHALMTPGTLNLRLHQDGIDWLGGAGASLFKAMMVSMSFQVNLFPDNFITGVSRDG